LLYDRLASRTGLPASATVDVTHHPVGNALKRPFGTAFEYSDCVVDDSRLVMLSAVDAAERGAAIRTGAALYPCRPGRDLAAGDDRSRPSSGDDRTRARQCDRGLDGVGGGNRVARPPPQLGTMQMGQIIVRRLFDSDNVYVFQNSDRRLIFASSL